MDSEDVVDDVNALLRLGAGDQYRLEHIKLAYIENKTLWESDKKYLERMKEKYLAKLTAQEEQESGKHLDENEENTHVIHCWKCGKKNLLKANFCMGCGTPLYDVGPEQSLDPKKTKPARRAKIPRTKIKPKFVLLVGIPVLVLAILGGAYVQGYFDGAIQQGGAGTTPAPISPAPGEGNSKCGAGTVFDPVTNACVLGSGAKNTASDDNSKCGAGTVFDPVTNACILK